MHASGTVGDHVAPSAHSAYVIAVRLQLAATVAPLQAAQSCYVFARNYLSHTTVVCVEISDTTPLNTFRLF